MALRSEEYWLQRLIELDIAEEELAKTYIDEIIEAYNLAQKEIVASTEHYFNIIAANQAVSLAEAKVLLTTSQLREFKYDLKKFRKISLLAEVDKSWINKLDNASARVNISRLEALNTNIEQSIQVATAKRIKTTTTALSDVYNDSFIKNSYITSKGVGYQLPFKNIDTPALESILKQPWTPDATNFSARIWTDRDKLVAQLKQDLSQQLIRGEQDINQLFDVYEKRFGAKRYEVERLIRTESTYFASAGRLKSYKETGVTEYKYVAIRDRRTSDICTNLDGKVFKVSEAQAGLNFPAMHPNCRSTTIPVINYDSGEEFVESKGYKATELPASYGFKSWSVKTKANIKPPEVAPPTSVFPKKVVTE